MTAPRRADQGTGSGLDRYGGADRARRADEPAKRIGAAGERTRTGFARDRARVLHSFALRRLAGKTQVVVPGEDDFPRTRLTHSLEVAQIAREMGAALGCDPDVVDTAGLAHDLGHPPFGHNGEDALDAVAAAIGGFEGNAQTLRILTRLEPKIPGAGLNLTRASLDAVCKYPWPRRPGARKFGVYAEDAEAFAWIRAGAPEGRRCLEAQVMDWADDVAYSVHDVEDGVHGGHIRLSMVDAAAREQVCRIAAERYSAQPAEALSAVLDELLELPTLRDLAGYDGSFVAQSAAKRATSELTGRFVGAAVTATLRAHGDGLARYAADLVVPPRVVAECALLKALAAHYVMRRPDLAPLLARQRRLLTELVGALAERGAAPEREALPGGPGAAGPSATNTSDGGGEDVPSGEGGPSGEDGALRAVIDQVAALTDRSAQRWHAELVGQR